MKKHAFVLLEGEALDAHMMKMHGWDETMIRNRGTQSEAQKSDYLAIAHYNGHATSKKSREGT